jgi:ribosomal-protein-alanine N-acetyltransferase
MGLSCGLSDILFVQHISLRRNRSVTQVMETRGRMNATTELILGPARRADLTCIAALARDAIETGLLPSWTEPRLERMLRQPETMVLVARCPPGAGAGAGAGATGEFAGFGIMVYGDTRAHLNLLGVEPPHQRRGIGGRILRWLERSALEAGTFDVTLEVRAANHAAQSFYLARGYEAVGRVERYYQGVEDAIRMRRDLRMPAAR